jgi:hypothetical protein
MDALNRRRIGSCAEIAQLYRWTGEQRKGDAACQPSGLHALAFRAEKSRGTD